MSNESLLREYFEAFYAADDAALERLLAPGFEAHVPGGRVVGAAEWRAMARMILDAVPDIRTDIDAVVADGEHFAVRYSSAGTHKGELFGAPGTGRHVEMPGIEIYRLADGRVAECWGQYDMTAVFGSPC